MDNKIKIKVNGQEVFGKPGQTILEVVQEQGLDEIPTLCHSPELKPYGSCFVCVVEVEGRPNLVPSCATKIYDGLEVHTKSEKVRKSRKTALELLVSNHYADCVSPCMLGCPAGVDAQGYIALAAMGENRKAIDLIRETNPFPAICGRVCVRKCELSCRREDVDEPVAINFIKRYVSDDPEAYEGGPERLPSRGKSIGIIGAGPAGLTASWFLGRLGYDTVLYEQFDRAGGMLRYGIPEYRLPDDVLDKEIDYILKAGGEIKYNTRVGRDVSMDELRKKHDAVFVSIGASTAKPMRVEGETSTNGVVTGVDFLHEKADSKEPVKGTIVVVGGGNTAMDCARTSVRLGADKVIILYRRTKDQMPADELEIKDALEEGVEIYELAAPIGIVKDNDELKALKCIRMKLGEPDASGRRRPVTLEGSEFELPCDVAISAIGQNVDLDGVGEAGDETAPEVTKWNTFVIEQGTLKTNIEGVFAGGDAADDGPTVVIDAIRDGQKAAKSIHHYLSGEERPIGPFIVTKDFWAKPGQSELGNVSESPRHHLMELDPEERATNFEEVATGFDYEDMVHEAERCLSCGCVRYYDCSLRLYAEQYGVDMSRYKGYVRKHRVDDRHPYIVYDPNKCVLCSRCIRTCDRVLPISALGLVNRGFKTEMRPALNDPLIDTNCISCGNCTDSCPTGALTIKWPFPGRSHFEKEQFTTHCGFCPVGCEITVSKIGEKRHFIESSGKPGDYLCRYGRFGYEIFTKARRLEHPVEREGGKTSEVSFFYAYRESVERFRAAVEKFGPDNVAVFVSPELSNEELYLASRIAREGLSTNNIGSISALHTGYAPDALDDAFGFTASTADRKAVRDADLIICNNTDTQSDQLILSVEIIDTVKDGAKLVVSNSIYDPLEELSSLQLDPMRGRSTFLWNGVIQHLISEGYFDLDAVNKLDGGEKFVADLAKYDLDATEMNSGVEVRKIRQTAEMLMDAQNVVLVHSPDRAFDSSPGDMQALANIVTLLREKGKKAQLLIPGMYSNTAGLALAGATPEFLPGRVRSHGLEGAENTDELYAKLEAGSIKAALVIGEDPFRHDKTASYFANTELLISMDWSKTETGMFANIAFPFSTYLESSGTRCNFEGRAVHFEGVVETPAGVPGWKMLAELASRFGLDVEKADVKKITAELVEKIEKGTGEMMPLYFNDGEDRQECSLKRALVVASAKPRAAKIPPAVTSIDAYKRQIHEVGRSFKVS